MPALSHVIYGIKIGSTCLGGIESQSLTSNINWTKEFNSGRPYAVKVYNTGGSPQASWTTNQIGQWLSATSVKELCMADNNVTFYLQRVKGCGARDTTGHISYAVTNGLLVPESLSWSVGGNAKLSYKAYIAKPDGGTTAYTVTSNATLPTIVDQEVYGLRSVSMGGTTLNGVTSFTLNFGVQVQEEKADGDYFARAMWVQQYEPSVSLDGIDANWLASSLDGTSGTLTAVFGQRSDDASFVADEDFSILADGVLHLATPYSGNGNEAASTSALLECTYDGTNHPIRIAS